MRNRNKDINDLRPIPVPWETRNNNDDDGSGPADSAMQCSKPFDMDLSTNFPSKIDDSDIKIINNDDGLNYLDF